MKPRANDLEADCFGVEAGGVLYLADGDDQVVELASALPWFHIRRRPTSADGNGTDLDGQRCRGPFG